jgi:hypothetical protein
LIENYTLICDRIVFRAVACSVELTLQHSIVLSSAYKIGLDDLFIKNSISIIYKRKIKGPNIEPCGTPRLQLGHSDTPFA